MGIILDTSVLIAGERRGQGVQAIIQRVLTTHGEQDAALSVGVRPPTTTSTSSLSISLSPETTLRELR
jgi:hypothetical protein